MKHFLVFGTHPRLSLAEFRSVNPDAEAPIICGHAALIDSESWDGTAFMQHLGGTVKLGDIVTELTRNTCTPEALAHEILSRPRAPRILFGISIFGGTPADHTRLARIGIALKHELTSQGNSVRWITSENNEPLSPAAVTKMHLTTEGYDLALLVHGETISVGLTTHVQDADAWSLRDYGRPIRDDENGMLPPKLARMMVNLARIPRGGVLLDPFCGSGTVLMEATLATHAAQIIGSDIEDEQVAATQKNLAWLNSHKIIRPDDMDRFHVFTSDVRKVSGHLSKKIDAVVTEGYLGPPLRGHESQAILTKNADMITKLWIETLHALHPLLAPNGRIVGIWPAFKTEHGIARVDLTDLEPLQTSYQLINPLEGWETSPGPFLYSRPGQRVARRIVILEPR